MVRMVEGTIQPLCMLAYKNILPMLAQHAAATGIKQCWVLGPPFNDVSFVLGEELLVCPHHAGIVLRAAVNDWHFSITAAGVPAW